jgi:hypothetical protein
MRWREYHLFSKAIIRSIVNDEDIKKSVLLPQKEKLTTSHVS